MVDLRKGAVMACAVVATGSASAGSVGNNGNYSFEIFEQFQAVRLAEFDLNAPEETQAGNLDGAVRRFAGSTTIEVPRFDPALGTLTSADLEATMNVAGDIFAPTGTTVTGYAWGGLELGPLEIDLDFQQYDGDSSVFEVININEFDSGFDATEAGDDLSVFEVEPLLLEISASFEYVYDEVVGVGTADSFTVSGAYDLVYNFDEVEDETPDNGGNVVPAPSAVAAGLLGLAGVITRRRRETE